MAEDTCWSLIHDAASGSEAAREAFSTGYLPVVRAALLARWGAGPLRASVEDAVQDVFFECLRPEGALGRLEGRGAADGRFRSYLFAVVRNVARRHEERHATRRPDELPDSGAEDLARREATCSLAFDRSWAQRLIQRAARRQEERATGEGRRRRVELLRLRFHEGLPIREIAELWDRPAAWVHHQYAKAREEFKDALREVVAEHGATSPGEIEREVQELLARL